MIGSLGGWTCLGPGGWGEITGLPANIGNNKSIESDWSGL